VAFDRDLSVRASHAVPVGCSFPGPGLVEQDPDELRASARAAIAGLGLSRDEVAAVGISNQTETFLVCERGSGRPIHPAIGWQDRRTADCCRALGDHAAFVRSRTGLELDATFPATKLRWLLDRIGDVDSAELIYRDVSSWLCGVDVCEASNAGRTLLCSLGGAQWDHELLSLFGVPPELMPPIVASDAIEADLGFPVTAALGDQQASLFGLQCFEPGQTKVTLGTGAFVLSQAGSAPPAPADGVLASCAWRRGGETRFALEGFVPAAGAALDWFSGLGILPPAHELDALLETSSDTEIICVPALQGLGTPRWDASVRGSLSGLTRATTRAEVARAVVDGVLHQVADALDAIGCRAVLLDGGVSRSDWITQRLADLAGVRVERAARADASAVGAAMMAGLAAGFWGSVGEFPPVATDLIVEPSLSDPVRLSLRARWAESIERASG
jgi:glycerol kinase